MVVGVIIFIIMEVILAVVFLLTSETVAGMSHAAAGTVFRA